MIPTTSAPISIGAEIINKSCCGFTANAESVEELVDAIIRLYNLSDDDRIQENALNQIFLDIDKYNPDIIYYNFYPEFMENYSNIVLKNTKPAELAAKTLEMEQMKEAYKNPFVVILYTYFEVFPLGVLVSLVTPTLSLVKQKLSK